MTFRCAVSCHSCRSNGIPMPSGQLTFRNGMLALRHSLGNRPSFTPLSGETAMPFYQKGDVRIRYEEAGSGFPLLVTPGGGLNSRVAMWPTAAINAMEEFKNDFRVITMDQRNANRSEERRVGKEGR